MDRRLAELSRRSALASAALADAQARARREAAGEAEAAAECADLDEASAAARAVAAEVQRRAHERVASLTARCLRAVFGPAYGFRVDFAEARGRAEARLVLVKSGRDLPDVPDSCGGGVADVAGFALRLAALTLDRRNGRRLLVADEPMKHLSGRYRRRAALLLRALADELDFQFVIVTHTPELASAADVVIDLSAGE